MKQRIFALLMALLVYLSAAGTAFAAETALPTSAVIQTSTPTEATMATPTVVPTTQPTATPAPTAQPTVSPTAEAVAPTALMIDTVHRFGDMSSAYQDGYQPKVEGSTVSFVLPLFTSAPLQEDLVHAALDLGPNGPQAFVAASYEKDFSLQEVAPSESTEQLPRYLVAFSVQLLSNRTNGVYPVTVHVSARSKNGESVTLDYTVFVTIVDGKSAEEISTPEPTPEPLTPEPVVYLSKTQVNPQNVVAGEPFTVTVTLQNSLKTKSVQNMLVTVDTGDLPVQLLEDSNVIPVAKIPAGGQKQLTLHFLAEPTLAEGRHTLKLHFQYNSSKALGLSADGICKFTARQPAKLTFDGAQLPVKVYQDDTVTVTTNLMNTGKGTLYNCKVDYQIEGLSAGGSAFVGELPAGEQKPASGNLRVSHDLLGEISGTILVQYEDAYGQSYQQTAEVTSFIEERPPLAKPEDEKKEKSSVSGWLWLLGGIALGLCGSLTLVWFVRDRRQRREDDLRL